MRKVKTGNAFGVELCHDVTAMREGFKGAAFKRGHVQNERDSLHRAFLRNFRRVYL